MAAGAVKPGIEQVVGQFGRHIPQRLKALLKLWSFRWTIDLIRGGVRRDLGIVRNLLRDLPLSTRTTIGFVHRKTWR
jgi:hypothetical protein